MRIIDVLTSPWAIQPEKYKEIIQIYNAHVRGEKIDIELVEAQLGRKLENEQRRYEVMDGVAIIPIEGVLAKKMNMLTRISGGSSTELIFEDFRAAMEDPKIKAVLLAIDSPGGTVDGTQDLAREIYESRGGKPIYTLANGTMASAAVWIGAAADKVFITNETTQVGSIGVVTTHEDISKWEEKQGIKTTEIYAGKYKRIASEYKPLSEEGRKYLQDIVDYIYSVFVEDVALFRGVTVEEVLGRMADGRLFIGKQAIDAGLVDGISTLDEAVQALLREDSDERNQRNRIYYGEAPSNANKGGKQMEGKEVQAVEAQATEITLDLIKRDYPHIAEALVNEGKEQGAAEERQRIMDVEAQSIPGHEELIAKLKFDGKTTGPEAAAQVLAAEKKNRDKVLRELEAESPKPVEPSVETPPVTEGLPLEEKAKREWEANEKLREEFLGEFDRYVAYLKAEEEGKARILGK